MTVINFWLTVFLVLEPEDASRFPKNAPSRTKPSEVENRQIKKFAVHRFSLLLEGPPLRSPFLCHSVCTYFPVIKNLTILPNTVIPRIMAVIMARKAARAKVNLKARIKRGVSIAQRSIVRHPVAKSFASSIGEVLSVFSFWRAIYKYIRCGRTGTGKAATEISKRMERRRRFYGLFLTNPRNNRTPACLSAV
jgi:hypothetical protein